MKEINSMDENEANVVIKHFLTNVCTIISHGTKCLRQILYSVIYVYPLLHLEILLGKQRTNHLMPVMRLCH